MKKNTINDKKLLPWIRNTAGSDIKHDCHTALLQYYMDVPDLEQPVNG